MFLANGLLTSTTSQLERANSVVEAQELKHEQAHAQRADERRAFGDAVLLLIETRISQAQNEDAAMDEPAAARAEPVAPGAAPAQTSQPTTNAEAVAAAEAAALAAKAAAATIAELERQLSEAKRAAMPQPTIAATPPSGAEPAAPARNRSREPRRTPKAIKKLQEDAERMAPIHIELDAIPQLDKLEADVEEQIAHAAELIALSAESLKETNLTFRQLGLAQKAMGTLLGQVWEGLYPQQPKEDQLVTRKLLHAVQMAVWKNQATILAMPSESRANARKSARRAIDEAAAEAESRSAAEY